MDCINMVVTMNPCKCGWHGRPSGHCIDLICSLIHRHMIYSHVAGAEREGMKKQISEMQQFLAEQQQDITEYDEQLVRRLIEKITVYDERVTVEFKSGTSVDVDR